MSLKVRVEFEIELVGIWRREDEVIIGRFEGILSARILELNYS